MGEAVCVRLEEEVWPQEVQAEQALEEVLAGRMQHLKKKSMTGLQNLFFLITFKESNYHAI